MEKEPSNSSNHRFLLLLHLIKSHHFRYSEIVDFKNNSTSVVKLPGLNYPIQQHCAVFNRNTHTLYIIGGKGDDVIYPDDYNKDTHDSTSRNDVLAFEENQATRRMESVKVNPLKVPKHRMACGFWKMNSKAPSKIVVAGGLR